MKKIEAVIFDWAGTTVDFGSMAPVQAFIRAFEKFGITPELEEVRGPMGKLKWDHIHEMLHMSRIRKEWKRVHGRDWDREDVDQVYRVSEEAILEILPDYAGVKPYVFQAVASLRERGIKIGSTTGYTDQMMEIVSEAARKNGYAPDACFTPNSVGDRGRPFPYMIFRNLEALGVSSVEAAVKVGDTLADIREGKNAGMISVGVVEGSSLMGLSEEEYKGLCPKERLALEEKTRKLYLEDGADYVIQNFSELEDLILDLEQMEEKL